MVVRDRDEARLRHLAMPPFQYWRSTICTTDAASKKPLMVGESETGKEGQDQQDQQDKAKDRQSRTARFMLLFCIWLAAGSMKRNLSHAARA
jgi:hypothetical protein